MWLTYMHVMHTAIQRNLGVQKMKNAIKNKISFYILNSMNCFSHFPPGFLKSIVHFKDCYTCLKTTFFLTIPFPIYITQCKYKLFYKYFQSLVCNWTGECFYSGQTLFSERIYCFLGPVEHLFSRRKFHLKEHT